MKIIYAAKLRQIIAVTVIAEQCVDAAYKVRFCAVNAILCRTLYDFML